MANIIIYTTDRRISDNLYQLEKQEIFLHTLNLFFRILNNKNTRSSTAFANVGRGAQISKKA